MIRVTKLDRAAGYWTANVTVNGSTVHVDRSSGSWAAPGSKRPAKGNGGRGVTADVAAELQDRVRRIERREARADA